MMSTPFKWAQETKHFLKKHQCHREVNLLLATLCFLHSPHTNSRFLVLLGGPVSLLIMWSPEYLKKKKIQMKLLQIWESFTPKYRGSSSDFATNSMNVSGHPFISLCLSSLSTEKEYKDGCTQHGTA